MQSSFDKNIEIDFKKSFEKLSDLKSPIVTVFGSARTPESDYYYQQSLKLTEQLSLKGCNILTGGGPGIMESANRGAFESSGNGKAIGFNITLPQEQSGNPYVDREYNFKHLFVRKPMLIFHSKVFVVFPGGFGTLDELFEVLTLVQTEIMDNRKVYLFGSEFYNPLLSFIEQSLLKSKMINPEDIELFKIVDSIDEIIESCNCKDEQ
jgi:uncharacterized protein (TIGR00730 family)